MTLVLDQMHRNVQTHFQDIHVLISIRESNVSHTGKVLES
jgi:hypothetical protein